MQPLVIAVRQFICNVPNVKRVLVACSGGVDSTVLLHCVAKAELNCPIAALHVNHQLSEHADVWQQRVQDQCAALGVACVHERVQVNAPGSGVEQAARQARYRAFERHLQEGDLLLTAHHQQDQTETFFLRLLRGAGLRGLCAMAPVRAHGRARVGRPLLRYQKWELLAYARDQGLTWVEDESNDQQLFDRNFLRAQVVPMLQKRWPAVTQQVLRTTELLQEAESLLADYVEQDIRLCEPRLERLGHSLLLQPLLDWPPSRRNHVVRSWLAALGYRMPEHKQFDQLARLLTAQEDKNPVLQWQDCEIRRFRQRLYCLPSLWQPTGDEAERAESWAAGHAAVSIGHSILRAEPAEQGLHPGRSYTVKLRSQCPEVGRAHPVSRGHSQSFKKLLQEYHLEPWLRPWLPLVFADGELVAVGDLWVEKGHLYVGESALALTWQIGPSGDRL